MDASRPLECGTQGGDPAVHHVGGRDHIGARVGVNHRLLDMGHARALLSLEGAEQIQVGNRVAHKGLSVRETERLVQALLNPPKKVEKAKDRDLLRLEEELSDLLGAKVTVAANRKGAGKMAIEFSSLDQLDELLARFR